MTFAAENSSSYFTAPKFVSWASTTCHLILCQTTADIPQGHQSWLVFHTELSLLNYECSFAVYLFEGSSLYLVDWNSFRGTLNWRFSWLLIILFFLSSWFAPVSPLLRLTFLSQTNVTKLFTCIFDQNCSWKPLSLLMRVHQLY